MLEDDNLSHLKDGLTGQQVATLPPMTPRPGTQSAEDDDETKSVAPGSPRNLHDVDLLEPDVPLSAHAAPQTSMIPALRSRKTPVHRSHRRRQCSKRPVQPQ
eukprot:805604-Amphidinium_carterae.2